MDDSFMCNFSLFLNKPGFERKHMMSAYSDIPMFYDAPAGIFGRAKYLRQHMTSAEKKVWEFVKNKNVLGAKFRAQHPLGVYIADFYCHKIRLIIEIDGEIHENEEQKEYDIQRSRDLNNWDIDLIRFTNFQVHNDFDSVKQKITEEVQTRLNVNPVLPNRSPI